jgi:hypothetical protein
MSLGGPMENDATDVADVPTATEPERPALKTGPSLVHMAKGAAILGLAARLIFLCPIHKTVRQLSDTMKQ